MNSFDDLDLLEKQLMTSLAPLDQNLYIRSQTVHISKDLANTKKSIITDVVFYVRFNNYDQILIKKRFEDLLKKYSLQNIFIREVEKFEHLAENERKSEAEETEKISKLEPDSKFLNVSEVLFNAANENLENNDGTSVKMENGDRAVVSNPYQIAYSEEQLRILNFKNFSFTPRVKIRQSRVNQIFRNKFKNMMLQMHHDSTNLKFRKGVERN